MSQIEEPCSAEPRVFVGQLPPSVTFDDIGNLFGQYGTVKQHKVSPSNNPSQPNKGYAMILYDSWGAAERAVDSQNGQNPFNSGKPMVVKIAQPTKNQDGIMPPPIAPKKLFIGQIPYNTSDEDIKELIQQYGKITEYGRLKKQGTQAADCAFIQLAKWEQCEEAIKNLNAKKSFDGQKPIVVKFANFHIRDQNSNQMQGGGQGGGFPQGGFQGKPNFKRPFEQFQQSNAAGGYNAGGGGGPGVSPGGGFQNQSYNKKQFTNNMGGGGYPQYSNGDMSNGPPFNNQTPSFGSQPMSNSMAEGQSASGFFGQKQGLPNSYQQGLGGRMGGHNSFQGAPWQQQQSQYEQPNPYQSQNQFGQANSRMRQGGTGGGPAFGGGTGGGRGGGAQLNDVQNKEWKLFVGQIPYDIGEYEVWQEFAKVGEILDVAVLRNNDGRSKGCAFVTFVTSDLAEQAIQIYNQQSPFPTSQRPLVVKLAG